MRQGKQDFWIMLDEETNNTQGTPKRDYFLRMYAILLLVMLGLLALYIVPSKIGSWWDIKPIDILSDLRTAPEDTLTVDPLIASESEAETSLPKPKPKITEVQQRQKNEQVYQAIAARAEREADQRAPRIEDFSAERTGLRHFFAQLHRRERLGRPVRIAVLGDSFVEADIFTDAVREGLQAEWGGGGVGLVGLASGVAGYRKSVRHEQRGWKETSLIQQSKRKYTIFAHLFEPKGSAWARYSTPSGGRAFDQATLYYYSPTASSLDVEVEEARESLRLEATDAHLGACLLYDGADVRRLHLSLSEPPAGFVSYGLALERRAGVTLDNMSLRGSSGLHLGSLDAGLNKAFASARAYDLIILQYGLNVANAKQTNYTGYAANMSRHILRLRDLYPDADVMILGVSDRAQRQGGDLRTMKAVELLETEQRALAESLGVTYFSLLEAMRSLGGVVAMSDRGETSKDFTHLSHKGGRRVASVFLEALALEKDYYEQISH